MEAEKSTFRGELSFQRSECTTGLTTFCAASIAILVVFDWATYFFCQQFRLFLRGFYFMNSVKHGAEDGTEDGMEYSLEERAIWRAVKKW